MLNKVIIEGDHVRSMWGSKKELGSFFVTIKQEKHFNKFVNLNYFSLYSTPPLATKLADICSKNPNCHLVIEGKLKTYKSKKDNLYHTTIMIEKILKWTVNTTTAMTTGTLQEHNNTPTNN